MQMKVINLASKRNASKDNIPHGSFPCTTYSYRPRDSRVRRLRNDFVRVARLLGSPVGPQSTTLDVVATLAPSRWLQVFPRWRCRHIHGRSLGGRSRPRPLGSGIFPSCYLDGITCRRDSGYRVVTIRIRSQNHFTRKVFGAVPKQHFSS